MERDNFNAKTDLQVFGYKSQMNLANSQSREAREQEVLKEMLSVNLEGSN